MKNLKSHTYVLLLNYVPIFQIIDFLLQKMRRLILCYFLRSPAPDIGCFFFPVRGVHRLLSPHSFRRCSARVGHGDGGRARRPSLARLPTLSAVFSFISRLVGSHQRFLSTAALGRVSFSLPVYRYLVATVRLVWRRRRCSRKQDSLVLRGLMFWWGEGRMGQIIPESDRSRKECDTAGLGSIFCRSDACSEVSVRRARQPGAEPGGGNSFPCGNVGQCTGAG